MRTKEDVLKELNNMKIEENNGDSDNTPGWVLIVIAILGLIIYL